MNERISPHPNPLPLGEGSPVAAVDRASPLPGERDRVRGVTLIHHAARRIHQVNGWQRDSRYFDEIASIDCGAQLCCGYHGLNITCRVNNNALAITRIIMPMKINSSGLWIKTRHARKCDTGTEHAAGSPGYRRPMRCRAAANGLPDSPASPARATRQPERSRS